MVRGSTEAAKISYCAVDHAAGTLQPYAGFDSVTSELPEKKTGSAPHYVVTDSQALTEIRERETSGVEPLHETYYFSVNGERYLPVVEPGSYAEQYAINQEIDYQNQSFHK